MTSGVSRITVFALLVGFAISCINVSAVAQSSAKDKRAKKKSLPKIESVTFVTKDGVELHADYLGGLHDKESVPILLLHDFDSSRAAMLPLASYLQKKFGHCVLVPDLRGHGESTRVQNSDVKIDRSKFRKKELASIFQDLEQCKRFLMAKNNAGQLNIDQLSVVAVGSTCIPAVHWVNKDWSWEPVGGLKQGKDIKSLVMISPVKRFKGLNITSELKSPLLTGKGMPPLPLLMTWGSSSDSAKDVKAIYQLLGKSRPKVSEKPGEDGWWENETLFKVERRTALAGMQFVKKSQDGINNDVGLFIDNKVVANKDDYRWQNRSKDSLIDDDEEEEDDEDDGNP